MFFVVQVVLVLTLQATLISNLLKIYKETYWFGKLINSAHKFYIA